MEVIVLVWMALSSYSHPTQLGHGQSGALQAGKEDLSVWCGSRSSVQRTGALPSHVVNGSPLSYSHNATRE